MAVVLGVCRGVQLAWTSDDAFISFRYARNLVDGLGLVYNAGERVEGYTNFLWTLWCALGLRLGLAAEAWANASGVTCFAITIALMAWPSWRRAQFGVSGTVFPIAALLLTANRQSCAFATSGLETSCFTLFAVASYLALARLASTPERDVRRAAAAAAPLGLATLTRPDGAVFVALGGAYVLSVARPRLRPALAYAAVIAAIALPYSVWKLAYCGNLLPNTYYAKSAMVPWWGQGWAYVTLYFGRYLPLVAGPVLALVLVPRRAQDTFALGLRRDCWRRRSQSPTRSTSCGSVATSCSHVC